MSNPITRTAPERIQAMTDRELRAYRRTVSEADHSTPGREYAWLNELYRIDHDLRWRSRDRWERVQAEKVAGL